MSRFSQIKKKKLTYGGQSSNEQAAEGGSLAVSVFSEGGA
jgi:hypothetical protein